MMTQQKIIATCIFIHSRLSGKYSDKIEENTVMCENSKKIEIEVKELLEDFEKQNFTISYLNSLPSSEWSKRMTHYYLEALKVMEKHIKKGDEVIEEVIGLTILSYMNVEKNIGETKTDIVELLGFYESMNIEPALRTKMMKIGVEIYEAIDKCNYNKSIRIQRKNNIKRKKR